MLRLTVHTSFKPLFYLYPQQIRTSTAAAASTSTALSQPLHHTTPINEALILRVCTVLYQQQYSSVEKLHNSLLKTSFDLTHEFFLQVCNKFPYSWRPIYKLHEFAVTQPGFSHTPTTLNKMLDVIGKSRNIDLLWDLLHEIGRRRAVTTKTYVIALKTLASARELKRCVEIFHIMSSFGYEYNVGALNKVVEALCKDKLVQEAKHVVMKLKDSIQPNVITYRWLIYGFCDVGDTIEASKIWNLMIDSGFEADIESVETMMDRLFKNNEYGQALKLLQSMRTSRMDDLGLPTYRLVINWLCKKGKIGESYVVFEEMCKRGIKPDHSTLASIIYGLLCKRRVREAYGVLGGIKKPDVMVFHGMIKGLLRLKRPREATQVFREMIGRGCEPTMHTYIMLLQGHLGRRGRKERDPLVNFDTIFVGGLVKAGKMLEATKYAERLAFRKIEVPRFDYNKFLHCFSNEEGEVMFEVMARKLREVGSFDLADIFQRYGEKMTTRDKRRIRHVV
ncbi:unnamed protein product [Cuscuta epithymum]|uniref:Pentatricopeptide repeat-containing protein n=1 Tax=Cuscuta epithymum TaxID=186058 RepID=A0AAV0EJY5_9ASTE|nr:unnamed protein product [Cuscuta epithymum]CAH9124461.1 unnamed protein product [Cuscuta epithymum]CAH9124465.1 unnamed protein product [Cuscuta epithymum]